MAESDPDTIAERAERIATVARRLVETNDVDGCTPWCPECAVDVASARIEEEAIGEALHIVAASEHELTQRAARLARDRMPNAAIRQRCR